MPSFVSAPSEVCVLFFETESILMSTQMISPPCHPIVSNTHASQIFASSPDLPPQGQLTCPPPCDRCPAHEFLKRNIQIWSLGVPIVVQWKQIRLGSTRIWVQSLALISGLGIWCCHELWCRSQTWLGSGAAVTGIVQQL